MADEVERAVLRAAARSLAALLQVVELERRGRPVRVDSVRLRRGRRPAGSGAPRPWPDLERFEPRLTFIAAQLGTLLDACVPLAGGRPVAVDGFRVRDPADFTVDRARDHNVGNPYYDVIKYLSWPCRAKCEFCFHRGDPPGHFTRSPAWRGLDGEVAARVEAWRPDLGRALFSRLDYSSYETLTHPQILPVLRALRQKSRAPFDIVTNGLAVDEALADELQRLGPCFLVVSLNAVDPEERRRRLGDADPGRVLRCLDLLRSRGIPFAVSIVPWGAEGHLAGLEQTIRFAAERTPLYIRVNLPGYTRFSPQHRRGLDPRGQWPAIVDAVRRLRGSVPVPLRLQPIGYEESTCYGDPNAVIVTGTVVNSPAALSGILPGDELLEIAGIPVGSRPWAKRVLSRLAADGQREFDVVLARGGRRLCLRVAGSGGYPYLAGFDLHHACHPFGVVIMDGLAPGDVRRLYDLMERHGARDVLLHTSHLVRPALEALLASVPPPEGVRLHLEVPENRAFLGGSIVVGDMLVVPDHVACLRRFVRARGGKRPDLLVLPSTGFSRWRRDMAGVYYRQIERRTGVPTVLLECRRMSAMG